MAKKDKKKKKKAERKKKQKKKTKKGAPQWPEFNKYEYYENSVQSPENDVRFMRKVYRDINGKDKTPTILREDFCGTFQICCEWVKLGSTYISHGLDIDEEPLGYGMEHHFEKLKPSEKGRLQIHKKNVLFSDLPKADVACAVNFSYFIFKERETLKRYFTNAHRGLNDNGIFVLDCFGGPENCAPNEEETEYTDAKYSYFWDQESYDPINNGALFHIHFQRKGEKKRERCFTYDWRMWSIPELRDLLAEAGFSETMVYWEGTDKDGEGDGIFRKTTQGEVCDTWLAYVVGVK